MSDRFERMKLLVGDGVDFLKEKRVLVFGLGGVGSYVVEALARSAIGSITVVDNDVVSLSNINRQLYALESTVGMKKTGVARNRILDINPQCKVVTFDDFVTADNAHRFVTNEYDYIIDAIDNVTAKLAIAQLAHDNNIPIISSMGTGNKLDATKFSITDISKTSVCPLARVMRVELKKRGINHMKVLYSTEQPVKAESADNFGGRTVPGSISFVPSVAGLLIAGEVIKDLLKQ